MSVTELVFYFSRNTSQENGGGLSLPAGLKAKGGELYISGRVEDRFESAIGSQLSGFNLVTGGNADVQFKLLLNRKLLSFNTLLP